MPPLRETVILLHGLGRTAWSMRRLERALRRDGYRTLNATYPSRSHPIAELSDRVVGARVAEALAEQPERLHFVTHSLGGVLARHYAEHHALPEGTRAVMLAPPHGGSEMADVVRRLGPVRWWCGPALDELGMDATCGPQALGPVQMETGVIAGTRSYHPWAHHPFGGLSDGIVSVAHAQVEGMADFLSVPRGHALIMRAPEVIHQTRHFLRYGHFDHVRDTQAV